MERIGNLFGQRIKPPVKKRRTERGDLFDAILSRINPTRTREHYPPITPGRLGYLLARVPTKDIYALVSKCDDAERRGVPWGAAFWTEIRPRD